MASKNKTTPHFRHANLFLGAAGVEAATAVGYKSKDTNVVVTLSRADGEFFADDEDLPVLFDNRITGVMVEAGLWQFEAALWAFAMGIDAAGQAISPTNSSTWNEHSVKIVGALLSGTAFTIKSKWAKPSGDMALTFDKSAPTVIPVRYKILAPTVAGNNFDLYIGSGSDEATLSTGALTRTASVGYHIVVSESGATDTLDSITGASLTDNETLRLQPADGDAITLTHQNDTLELWGDANWVMDSPYDFIDLQYDSANTKWVETQRFDYSSAV